VSRRRWPAYAAATWAFAFAAISFYWGLGGTVGLDTLAVELERDARAGGAEVLALAVAPGIAKLALGLLALALAHPGRSPLPRRPLVVLAWLTGIGLTLYGAVMTAEKALMELGAIDVPASFGDDRVVWYLFFWDPLWLVGGILFLLAAQASSSSVRTSIPPSSERATGQKRA
jgi:Protein of unknown function (DUF3995)